MNKGVGGAGSEAADEAARVSAAWRYGRNISSAGRDEESDSGSVIWRISVSADQHACMSTVITRNSHLPRGVDMLPSPVTSTCAAVVGDPFSSDPGGKTRSAVSTS